MAGEKETHSYGELRIDSITTGSVFIKTERGQLLRHDMVSNELVTVIVMPVTRTNYSDQSGRLSSENKLL